jgi:hypothetical protein
MKIINKTRWRTDHIRTIVSAAILETGVPLVTRNRLIVWVLRSRPGRLQSWGNSRNTQIVLVLPNPALMTARMVGRLALDALADMLGRQRGDKSAWRMETLPLRQRLTPAAPVAPTTEQRRMARFKKAAALAAKWKRAIKHATSMHRKWSRRAARMHRELNRGMTGGRKP